MIHLVDTGLLVAAFRRPEDKDPFTPWAAMLLRSLPYPRFTCDAVLTEAAQAIDRIDFAVYRRHGRETIPLLLPD
jgi:hypothetical protein